MSFISCPGTTPDISLIYGVGENIALECGMRIKIPCAFRQQKGTAGGPLSRDALDIKKVCWLFVFLFDT